MDQGSSSDQTEGEVRSRPSERSFRSDSAAWVDHPGLVLGPGPTGRCDDARVGGAAVEHDLASGGWRLWYYCRDQRYARAAPATLGTGRVALATSPDGIAWQRVDGLEELGSVLAPAPDEHAFDSGHVGLTDVTQEGAELRMWTFGGDNGLVRTGLPALGDVTGLAMRCGVARSQDGVAWRRIAGAGRDGALFDILDDELYAAWPNVLPQRDGSVLLHYTAPSVDMALFRTRVVRLAASGEVERLGGLRWLDGAAEHDAAGVVTRHAIAHPGGGGWLMAYTGLDARHHRSIALAESSDGLAWRHVGGPVLLPGAPGRWDDFGVAANRLVVTQDRLHLYYYGFRSLIDLAAPRGIGLAIADRAAPHVFRKVGT